jgi:hypothetical protein
LKRVEALLKVGKSLKDLLSAYKTIDWNTAISVNFLDTGSAVSKWLITYDIRKSAKQRITEERVGPIILK